LRIEHLALHVAQSTGGAQWYISCAQVTVTGAGGGSPSPTALLPGAYVATDPGILIDIYYPIPTSYTPPGPAVWGGGTSVAQTSAVSSSTPTTVSTVVVKPTTAITSAASGSTGAAGTAALYGQCGGIGWTGPTVCASGSTCTASNSYYSQCL